MVNRFGRSPGALSPFDPKGALPDGLPAVQRGAGQEAEALFQAGSQLAGIFNRDADRQAAIEGKRDGAIAGNDPNFRPEGRTSIRGAAFEEAAKSTYLDNLSAKMSAGMLDRYQQFKDNPAGLKASLDTFKQDMLDNDVFPEIAGQVSASFERSRLPFQVKALAGLEERQRDDAAAARLRRDQAGGALNSRKAEAAPDDPRNIAEIDAWRREEEGRDQAEVANKTMTAEQAELRRQKRDFDINSRRYGAKIESITTIEQWKAANDAYEADKKAGRLGRLGEDARLMDDYETKMAKRLKTLTTAADTVTGKVTRQADDMLDRASRGAPPPDAEVRQFSAAATVVPGGERKVREFDRRLSWVQAVDAQGPEAAEGFVRKLRETAGPTPTKEQADDIQFLHDLIKKRREEVVIDPIGLASRLGIAKVPQLNIEDPAALAAGLRDRIALADALPPAINPERKALEPETKKAIARKIEMGGPGAAATIEALVRGSGKDAPRIMRELGGVMPEAAHAGVLMAQGGSPEAARDILNGLALREMAKSGGGAKLPTIKADALNTAFTRIAGGLLDRSEEERSRLKKSAETIVQSRVAGGQDVTPEILEQAVRDVLGENRINGKVYGGVGKTVGIYDSWRDWRNRYDTIVPPEVEQGRFGEVLSALRDDDLKALPNPPAAGVTAAQLRAATPVLMSGGYRFALGDPNGNDPRFLRNAAGGFFTLPWEGVRGVLADRVPGAFKGGKR